MRVVISCGTEDTTGCATEWSFRMTSPGTELHRYDDPRRSWLPLASTGIQDAGVDPQRGVRCCGVSCVESETIRKRPASDCE